MFGGLFEWLGIANCWEACQKNAETWKTDENEVVIPKETDIEVNIENKIISHLLPNGDEATKSSLKTELGKLQNLKGDVVGVDCQHGSQEVLKFLDDIKTFLSFSKDTKLSFKLGQDLYYQPVNKTVNKFLTEKTVASFVAAKEELVKYKKWHTMLKGVCGNNADRKDIFLFIMDNIAEHLELQGDTLVCTHPDPSVNNAVNLFLENKL